ncbi:AIPR family protein [Limimaricola variabilis]
MVAEQVARQLNEPDVEFPSEELIFADLVMQHLQSAGLCDNYDVCHWTGKVGQAKLRISGHALSTDDTRLDLLLTHFLGSEDLQQVRDTEVGEAARAAVHFLKSAAAGRLLSKLDPSSDVFGLVEMIQRLWSELDQVRIFVITDGQTKSKHFKGQEVQGKSVLVEAIDIERFYRHISGKPREEIEISFPQAMGTPLACVHVPDPAADYEYALTAIPGEVIRVLYERHNTRLLEANVRTFLGTRGKVNSGIAATLETEPEHFMAFNNGLVIVCDEAEFARCEDGSLGISLLRGLQIVNGGQTTSSLYFAKRDRRDIDISHVRVPAKIVILKNEDDDRRDRLISDISRYANSQNAVKMSDLSANRPFHVQVEKLSQENWRPDGVGRWFYERAAGSYNVLLMREGTTPSKRKKIIDQIPKKRVVSKSDAARYLEAWRQKPAQVSLGAEKNLAEFMAALDADPSLVPDPLDGAWYRALIGKAIIFQSIQGLIKAKAAKATFRQGWINISVYVLSLVANRLGDQVDFEEIWRRQDISPEFAQLLYGWAESVNDTFHEFAPGRQYSEIAKRPELWLRVRAGSYGEPPSNVPELKSS